MLDGINLSLHGEILFINIAFRGIAGLKNSVLIILTLSKLRFPQLNRRKVVPLEVELADPSATWSSETPNKNLHPTDMIFLQLMSKNVVLQKEKPLEWDGKSMKEYTSSTDQMFMLSFKLKTILLLSMRVLSA